MIPASETTPPALHTAARCGGLVARRLRWGLTGRGWLLLLVVMAMAGWGAVRLVHPFLAVTAEVDSPVVVVEAWIPPPVLHGVAQRYAGDAHSIWYCVGGPSEQNFNSTKVEDTSAAEAARMLKKFGLPSERIKIVPCWVPRKDRTYSSAVALRDWFAENGINATTFNVVTEGPHGRRSRLMFEKAFGQGSTIGIIAITDPTYDATRWWQYSEGIKAVISETAGYLFARFFFRGGQ